MATATERKFTGLRKRLDQVGYRQPLGLESLPLVDKLFGDLLHTTESLKTAKQQLGKHREEKTVWDQHVEPYQADNARVIKENNELHQQMIRLKENSEQRLRELKAVLRRFEHENTDLKFLNTQYLQRLRSQEKESDRKTEKILELQEKNFQAVIQTPGGKKKNIPFRRQRMEIDCALPENSVARGVSPASRAPDPHVADLLQVADQRMSQLQALVDRGDKEKEQLEESLHSMRKLVENREGEIERLTLMLKGGRPAEALAAEGIRQSKERMVAHLNIQVDFLQKASRELENKLAASEEERAQLEGRVTELGAKNARICSELQEIGDLVKQTEQEREGSEHQLKDRIKELKAEHSRMLGSQYQLEKDLEKLEAEKAELLEDNQRMASLIASSDGDRKEVGGLLERLSEERKSFQRQVEQFKDREASLQHQVAELESKVAPLPAAADIRKLRKERDDLKDAVCSFEAELEEIQQDTKVLAEDRDNFKLLYEQVNEELARCKQQARSPAAAGAAIIRRAEGERDHSLMELQQKKTECRSLQDRLKSLQDTQQHDLNTLEDKLAEVRVQLEETCGEREELERHLASTKKLLVSMETELENSTKALSAANSELVLQRGKASQLQALVESSERTRQEQQKGLRSQAADVQSVQSAMAALNSKIATMSHELSVKEEKVSELRQALTMLDQDHDKLVREVDRKDEAIATMAAQLEQKGAGLARVETQIAEVQLELSQVEGICRAKEVEASEIRGELDGTNKELDATREHVNRLTAQVRNLRNDLATMTQENQAVHNELRRTVDEKESLELKCGDYAQTLSHYEEAVALKEQEKSELVQSYSGLNTEAERLTTTVRDMEGRLSEARSDLLALSREKQQAEEVMLQQSCEIQTLKNYEQQLSNMSHALSKMEGTLRQEQEEKKALITDLEVTRELCVQLDRSKDSLNTQLSTHSIHYEQLHSELTDLKAERDLLKVQLGVERSSSEQLQALISTGREKEFKAHMEGQEKEEEVQHLRQILAKLEADRLTLSDQTRKLRADTAVQSEALQRLKSELTSEKFQKEHMKQQLEVQRTSLTMLTSPTLHATTKTPSPPRGSSTTPKPELPDEPGLSSPGSTPSLQPESHDSRDEERLIPRSRDRQDYAAHSANIVDQLLQASSSSDTYTTPSSTVQALV